MNPARSWLSPALMILPLLAAQTPVPRGGTPVFGTTVVDQSGLRGLIYYIPPGTNALPHFGELEPVGAIYTNSLAVSRRSFSVGFPGVTDRFEWFAIDYTGRFWIDTPGNYRFALTADDGARLYIDGQLAIDNDGVHEAVRRLTMLKLSGGIHQIRVSYFQGPRFEVALVLEVASPDKKWRKFNTNEFKPPSNPADWKFGDPNSLEASTGPLPKSSLQAPRQAHNAFVDGLSELSYGELAHADASLRRAVEVFPDFAQAWSSLGEVLEQESDPEQAREAYEKALVLDPAYIKPYVHLANLALTQGRNADAAAIAARAMALKPAGAPLIYFYAALANSRLGRWDFAEKAARRAAALDMAHEVPRAEYLLGMTLAAQGAIPEAVEHMRRYLEISPRAQDGDEVRSRIAQLESTAVEARQ